MGILSRLVERLKIRLKRRKKLLLSEEVLLPAVAAFQDNTTFLWPALVATARKGGKETEFTCDVRFRNFNKILPHLERLVETGCLEFTSEPAEGKQVSGEGTLRITICHLHPAFLRWVMDAAFNPTPAQHPRQTEPGMANKKSA